MSEIAYHANLTEATVRHFFENRNDLITELSVETAEKIRTIIDRSPAGVLSFQERFHRVWVSLYEFYSRNPAIVSFVEQCGMLGHDDDAKAIEERFAEPLVGFFRPAPETMVEKLSAETLAAVFHGNILTAVKLRGNHYSQVRENEIRLLPALLWSGLRQPHQVLCG